MKPGATPRTKSAESDGDARDGVASRLAAFAVLETVLSKGRSLDEAWPILESPAHRRLSDRDRAFARQMVLTCLRRLGQIDAVLGRFLKRRPSGKARAALTLLRLGAAQILFLKTQPHAAVSTILQAADAARLTAMKGMLNAVLRKCAAAAGSIAQQDAARLNTPDWLWSLWVADHGVAAARRIAEAHLSEPPTDITLNRGRNGGQDWAERLGALRTPTGSLRATSLGDPRAAPGFKTGAWWVQDAAAALPARLLIDSLPSADGEPASVIDLCAAPGGKTAQLAAAGCAVTALDISAPRLARLRENLDRLGLAAEIVQADATVWRTKKRADAVLLDAPCSATGTIRRHPDLPWIKDAASVNAYSATQMRLLGRAADMLKPGGVLIYATCSLQKTEGEEAAASALEATQALEPWPIPPDALPGLPDAITAEGYFRTFPYFWSNRTGAKAGGMDGFFIARFRRRP
ncbi:MAG: transcription antitermination factor NusB [Alphaproteobacteria bacterium]|nr:transcription antitermination factor NusB [Alphaproteobacteria bacterium]